VSSLPLTSYEAQASYEVTLRPNTNFLLYNEFYTVNYPTFFAILSNLLGYILSF
jgi:hypothetical protein